MINKEILLEINNKTIKSDNLIELKNNHYVVSTIQNDYITKIGINDHFIYLSRGQLNDWYSDRRMIGRSDFTNYQTVIEYICVMYNNLIRDDQIRINEQLQRSQIYSHIMEYFKIDSVFSKDNSLQFIFNEYLITVGIYSQFENIRVSASVQDSNLNEVDYNQFIGNEKEVINGSIKLLEKYIK